MKDKLLSLIDEMGEVYFTDLPELLPECVGEYAIHAQLKEGYNPNVLLLNGVSQDFIEVFNDLVQQQRVLEIDPRGALVAILDGCPMYGGIPVATMAKVKKGKKLCWLPVVLRRKVNNP